ncbi:hypothetical protein [Nonomuraea ceibae]|uniref:hypothetical protein n=1 Tax=Nonomuraea ceibae TaxID=1935170 RepID=UPI001C5EF2EE|nr:hypothetical protein [Nonomuraea ceibae]
MTIRAWLNKDHQLPPGEEIFRSERRFALWAYSVSHGQTLFRSTPGSDGLAETTVEVLFKPVTAMKIRAFYQGLLIRTAPAEEAERVKAGCPSVEFGREDRVFLLESSGETDYVISMAVGWHEGVLAPTRRSFFTDVFAGETRWPATPLPGVDAGFGVASAVELIAALRGGGDGQERARRERYRHVHVVMTREEYRDGPYISGSGVFLTLEDAEEAKAALAPHVADCWIETLPVAV